VRRRAAGDGRRSQNRSAYGKWPRPVTGRRRGGVLNITAAVWTAGFQWWRSGIKKRTQNVSDEYMLVLALCLVFLLSALYVVSQHLIRAYELQTLIDG